MRKCCCAEKLTAISFAEVLRVAPTDPTEGVETCGTTLGVLRKAEDSNSRMGFTVALTLEVRGCGAHAIARRNHAGSAVPLDRWVRAEFVTH